MTENYFGQNEWEISVFNEGCFTSLFFSWFFLSHLPDLNKRFSAKGKKQSAEKSRLDIPGL